MKKITGFRILMALICLALTLSLWACSLNNSTQAGNSLPVAGDAEHSSPAPASADKSDKGIYENLVINDLPIEDHEYLVEKVQETAYILLSDDILPYALKLPNSNQYYPDLSLENGQISLTWRMNDQPYLKIDMVEGSTEAYINDSNEPIDIKVAPRTVNAKLYIPINLIVQSLNMGETYDKDLQTTFLHYQENFSTVDLVGCWSDTGTNSFEEFKNALQGNGSLASFVTAYEFNEDGTYQVLLLGVGGFDEQMVMCKGRYTILGNTLIYQQVEETLYEGNPLEMVHENQKLDHPVYEFIDFYDKASDQIGINGFLLQRVTE